ncbi:ABC transporter substrate-binding protein [Actinophytocola sp.]|uniref:ABC transporter substrate-binding protein n=1 Tax=Actinophytocola sp. TaxID=1872138 RepID=UPI002ED0E729
MRHNSPRILVLLAALVLTLSACGSGASGGSSSDTIKIGGWMPLSGPVAASGEPQKVGGDVYFKMINDKGGINGHKVEWITKDNAYDTQQTVQAARELIGQDRVVAIVNSNGTAQTEATFPFVLEQSKVPILNTYGGAENWYNPPRNGLFGVQTLYEDQAAAIAKWAVEDGAKKILVIHSDPAAFVNVANQVAPVAKKADSSVSVDLLSVKFQTTDYAPIVSQVKEKQPDAVITILTAPEAAAYLKEAKLQGFSAPAYGYAPDAQTATLTLGGDAAEGYHAVSWFKLPTDDSPEMKEYRDAMAKYAPDAPVDFSTLIGFAYAKAFAEIVKTIDGDITSDSIIKAYENAKNVETGIMPPLTFSAQNHLGATDLQRVTVKGGKWTSVGDFFTPPARD